MSLPLWLASTAVVSTLLPTFHLLSSMPDVSMTDTSEDLVLELLTSLKGLHSETRMQHAKQKANILTDELKALSVAPAQVLATPRTSGSVRVTICSADKMNERKLVVLQRSPEITELLKTAKGKLRLKKLNSARMVESGVAVTSTAQLRDGDVVAVSADAPQPAAEATSASAAPAAAPPVAAEPPPPISSSSRPDSTPEHSTVRARRCLLPQRGCVGAAPSSAAASSSAAATEAAAALLEARQALPIAAHKPTLLDTIGSSAVTVVQGEPGCGKSTQVPQFLLESLDLADTAIVVTQPRRVSAISLAHRVAEERGEPLGETVGYAVRGEVRSGARCRLLFCTTGWLLKQLAGCLAAAPDAHDNGGGGDEPAASARRPSGWCRLHRLSHVIVDEVHERSMLSDLLLTLLRRCVAAAEDEERCIDVSDAAGGATASRPYYTPPRVIAMSATVDAAAFASFFGGCPTIRVPGRTFPVRTSHLEEVVCMLGLKGPPAPLSRNEAELDFQLTQRTIEHVILHGEVGAILVFLSGMREIEQCCHALLGSSTLRRGLGVTRGEMPIRVVPLYGSLPSFQQRRAFDAPPEGTRKIVVATNVAETSVTIADVVHVIDVGLVKMNRWNPATRLVTFKDERVCNASAEQRRGRAGRVQAGHCYRLWPASVKLVPQAAPEIQRAPLEDIILDACLLGASAPAAFLADVPTPPNPKAVALALENLVSLQAIELAPSSATAPALPGGAQLGGWRAAPNASALRLTPLGVHLGRLPVDPRVGKLLLLAALTECLHPILSVAAALSTSVRVFQAPRDKQNAASEAQLRAFGAGRSDPLAIAAAFDGWMAAREVTGGRTAEREYCDAHFLSSKALREIEAGRKELLQQLQAVGFVPTPPAGEAKQDRNGDGPTYSTPCSAHAGNIALQRGIICAAFYPHVAAATRTTAHGSRQQYEKLVLAGPGDVQAWMHPSSINARPDKAESGLYVYSEKVESKTAKGDLRLFLRDTTRVPASAVLLFGAKPNELDVEKAKQSGRVECAGGGLRIRASPQTVLLYRLLRRELDGLLARKAKAPEDFPERGPAGKAILETVRAIVKQD